MTSPLDTSAPSFLPLSFSLSLPSPSSVSQPSSMLWPAPLRKYFRVTTLRSLSRRQPYVLVLDLSSLTLDWHKMRRGVEVRRSFFVRNCLKLQRHANDASACLIVFHQYSASQPLSMPTNASSSAIAHDSVHDSVMSVSQGSSHIHANSVGHALVAGAKMKDVDNMALTGLASPAGRSTSTPSPHSLLALAPSTPTSATSLSSSSSSVWQKMVFFSSHKDREEFCHLVHAAIACGEQALTMFIQTRSVPSANSMETNTTPYIAAPAATNLFAPEQAPKPYQHSSHDACSVEIPTISGMSSPARLASAIHFDSFAAVTKSSVVDEYCRFLIGYCAAQQELDTEAINLANAAAPTSSSPHPIAIGQALPSFPVPPVSCETSLPLVDSRSLSRSNSSSHRGSPHLAAALASNSENIVNDATISIATLDASAPEIAVDTASLSFAPNLQDMFGFDCLEGEIVHLQSQRATRIVGPSFPHDVHPKSFASAAVSLSNTGYSPVTPLFSTDTSFSPSSRGNFFLTNYRIIFRDYRHVSRSQNKPVSTHSTSLRQPFDIDSISTQTSVDATASSPTFQEDLFHSSAHASVSFRTECFADCDIPLGSIDRVVRVSATSSTFPIVSLAMLCKEGRRVEFTFDTNIEWCDTLHKQIIALAHTHNDPRGVFAFDHGRAYRMLHHLEGDRLDDGWRLYEPLREYHRLGLLTNPLFRLTRVNDDYSLCSSYPRSFVVPASITDAQLRSLATYRSRGRIPAIVYIHPLTGATLSRAAQPLPGLKGKRNEHDEALLAAIRECTARTREQKKASCAEHLDRSSRAMWHNPIPLVIVDARPYKAAMGNVVMGKGYENTAHYPHCVLHFMNIDNIHAIRSAHDRLNLLCSGDISVPLSLPTNFHDDTAWLSKLEQTSWLHLISMLLTAAVKIASCLVLDGTPVFVHCSGQYRRILVTFNYLSKVEDQSIRLSRIIDIRSVDSKHVMSILISYLTLNGWDRTAQLSSLVLLMLDGYSRTLNGFACLIEREWCSFGHKFAERFGQCQPEDADRSQRAPIFAQFLDCVFQCWRQWPQAFEFNEDFLVAMCDAPLQHRYGTFLFDSERERNAHGCPLSTVSVWSHLLSPGQRKRYTNRLFNQSSSHYDCPPCIPDPSPKRIVLFEKLHLRWETEFARQNHKRMSLLHPDTQLERKMQVEKLKVKVKYNSLRSRLRDGGVQYHSDDDGDSLFQSKPFPTSPTTAPEAPSDSNGCDPLQKQFSSLSIKERRKLIAQTLSSATMKKVMTDSSTRSLSQTSTNSPVSYHGYHARPASSPILTLSSPKIDAVSDIRFVQKNGDTNNSSNFT